ncbi:hypothetical protein QBC40DRAFT_299699 [Triangularia verruculosa]|uniref:Prolyl 4-hydroxylase alpha subunit domain-containing protein n=1 Tax=Triangularia verruculosa TaxID=2587418 RepID=A0AAN7AQ81_9PEZI|nr:hypothetical protein QBC40DRAFT_299699 [Triangularia verruculosa]
MAKPLHLIALSMTVALSAYLGPLLLSHFIPGSFIQHQLNQLDLSFLPTPIRSLFQTPSSTNQKCPEHTYTTHLISLDPLLIYISNFVSQTESQAIVDLSNPLLEPSPIVSHGTDSAGSQARTSWSAPLAQDSHLVNCILARSSSFLGTLLSPGRDEMGPAQVVRYTDSQKFDLHTDWFARPRITDEDRETGRRRLYNRVATFFVVLQSNITEGSGETWFPKVRSITPHPITAEGDRVWREHEDGGLAFKPIPGNAIFWVNLLPNGTGDARTVHAGLPVKGGVKTGMNIWPRVFFGPDA